MAEGEAEIEYAGYGEDEYCETHFDWATEEWVPAAMAMQELVNLYASVRDGDRIRAERDAIQVLLRRLCGGQLWARSPNWKHSIEHVMADGYQDSAFAPVIDSSESAVVISPAFWGNVAESIRADAGDVGVGDSSWSIVEHDWIAGDFYLLSRWGDLKNNRDEVTISSITHNAYAFSVAFNRSGLPNSTFDESQNAPRRRVADDVPTRLPRLPEAALLTWWDGLEMAAKSLPLDTLWHHCKAVFPSNSISRDRIRALDPGRKPGPRPISDKPTA